MGWGYDPVHEDHGDLPITDPWPLRSVARLSSYPCRVGFGTPFECAKPSTRPALGNEARYGHVCEECWQGFPPEEQRRYAAVCVARREP